MAVIVAGTTLSGGGASLSNGSANRLVTCADGTNIVGESFCEYNSSNSKMTFKSHYGTNNGTTYTAVTFQNLTTSGSISVTQNSTNYNTSSDYRLKENVSYDWDATTRLKQLKPARFNFKVDKDKTVDGFLAHEVSDIVPEAIGGVKDETQDLGTIKDKDGNVVEENVLETKKGEAQTWTKTKTENVYQTIDHSKLVPLLVKTIQELEARVATLEKA